MVRKSIEAVINMYEIKLGPKHTGSRSGRRVYGTGITGNRVQVKGTWLRV